MKLLKVVGIPKKVQKMKYFRFFEYSFYKKEYTPWSPYFTQWVDILKKLTGLKKLNSSQIYTIDQILSLPNLSATTTKAINGARPGTFIKLSRLSNSTELGIIRLDENQVSSFNQLQEVNEKLRIVNEQIRQCIPTELTEELKKLETLRSTLKDI